MSSSPAGGGTTRHKRLKDSVTFVKVGLVKILAASCVLIHPADVEPGVFGSLGVEDRFNVKVNFSFLSC